MNLDNVSKDKDRAIIDSILATVEKQFCGNECKIWLSGVSRDDAEKAASTLRADHLHWSFSVEAHGASGTYLVLSHSRLAQSGHFGDH
ncbi:hypothetical protein KBI23_05730 [bacterium]|nr:hypothetical protein [bacterium]MBP9810441.1 hypothetical protein [bacterium]